MRRTRLVFVLFLVIFLAWSGVAFSDLGIVTSPNITATAVGPREVKVSWEPANGENVGYEIIRSTPDNPNLLAAIGTVSADVYSYTDTTVSPNSSYYYAVTPIYLQSQSRGMDYVRAFVTTPNEPLLTTSSEPLTNNKSSPLKNSDAKPIVQVAETTSVVSILKIGSKEMNVQGKNITLDVAPIVENGRTLVPLRAISEALGAEVIWNEHDQTITVVLGQGN